MSLLRKGWSVDDINERWKLMQRELKACGFGVRNGSALNYIKETLTTIKER